MTRATFDIEIEGLEDTLKALTRLGDAGIREAEKALDASALKVQRDAKDSILRGTKSGKVYTRAGGQNLSATHRASDEGEAPANDTGLLVDSIIWDRDGLDARVFTRDADFSGGENYPSYLEFGTINMAARPFMRPALKKNQDYIVRQMQKAMERATQEFNR